MNQIVRTIHSEDVPISESLSIREISPIDTSKKDYYNYLLGESSEENSPLSLLEFEGVGPDRRVLNPNTGKFIQATKSNIDRILGKIKKDK